MVTEQSTEVDQSARIAAARQRLEELRRQIMNEECPTCRGYLREDYNKVARELNSLTEGEDGDSVKEFLLWLVRMDDPADEQGIKDRQTVRLSAIIDRARNLLGGA